MTVQTSYKAKIHQELLIRYREYLESRLAIHVLKQGQAFESVRLISKAILEIMQSNSERVQAIIANNPRIISDLREPFFGACFNQEETVSVADCFKKMRDILSQESADLKQVMQIHGVFIYRLFDALMTNPNKEDAVKKLFPVSLFNDRKREEKPAQALNSTNRLGIARHPVFEKRLDKSDKKHLRGMDRYIQPEDSLFFKAAKERNLPTACGPSGHTGSFLLGALSYGQLNQEQLQEYSFIIFSFLAAGGHHSFHEVMVVAQGLGLEYRMGEYSIPSSIQKSKGFEQLSRQL